MMHPSVTNDKWMIKDIFGNVVVQGVVPKGNDEFLLAMRKSRSCLTPLEVFNLMGPFIRKEKSNEQK